MAAVTLVLATHQPLCPAGQVTGCQHHGIGQEVRKSRPFVGLSAAMLVLGCAGKRAGRPWLQGNSVLPLRAGNSLINKLREKGSRPKPTLKESEAAGPISSALPPGTVAPELLAKAHGVLKERPELLEALSGPSDFLYSAMTAADAQELSDLQNEWFPPESYDGGAAWCSDLLSHPGVVAIKAVIPSDESGAIVGLIVALSSRAAIQEFTSKPTVDTLRQELTVRYFIPWDSPDRRELGYVLSVGAIGELRRRGVAAELLRRGLAELQRRASDDKGGTGLRAVALDLADYNKAAIGCYESCGFQRIYETAEAYAGVGRRTHSSFLYAWFPKK